MSGRDDDLRDEIAAHLRLAIEERVARGESRVEATRAARREFGNVTHVTEVTREMRGGIWIERLIQDVRYGLRALLHTPAFTVVAVLTLAIGVGANSAMFTVVNGVLLRPLPFAEPKQLFLASYLPPTFRADATGGLFDHDFPEYRKRTRVFERVTTFSKSAATLSDAGDATRLFGATVDADFFRVLGVSPTIGRAFAPDEMTPGNDGVVILSDRLWRERFRADSGIVGRTATLNGARRTIVGVMPAGFDFPSEATIWTPLARPLSNNWFLQQVVGRLRPGATPEQARVELRTIMRSRKSDGPSDSNPSIARVVPVQDLITGKVEKSLLILSAAVSFVLLIACANVANLLLIRAAGRRHEMAIRVALGAGRARLVTQLLTESSLVALIGGTLGTILGVVGVRALISMAPDGRIPRLADIHLDGRVLAFTLAVSLASGIAFGLAPALHASRRPPRDALGGGARTITGTHARVRGTLVVAEIALALVLLAGAGLMVKSFLRMRSVDKGFEAGNVAIMTAALPPATYADADRIRAFHTTVLERLARIPGVTSAGAASWLPLGGVGVSGDFNAEGSAASAKGYYADKPSVSPGYFRTMGIPLLRGRDFSPTDDKNAPRVVIVSRSVAEKVWPGQNPIAKRITMAEHPQADDWMTVVGVVNDVVQDTRFTPHSAIYLPYLQMRQTFFIEQMTYAVRGAGTLQPILRPMRGAIAGVDPNIAPQGLQLLDEFIDATTAEPLFEARLLAVFSIVALLLAAIGTYGVLAYDVSERTHEISLRMALGATRADVVRMILRRTATLVAPGVVLGLGGALAVTRVLGNALFEVKPTDPATLTFVAVSIVAVALLAGLVPAYRATRMKPAGLLAS